MTHEVRVGDPPRPDGARTVSELAASLRALQVWAGVSVREVHRRVVLRRRARGVPELPALDTVHRCLRPGRTRLDAELVTDIAGALLGDEGQAAQWRQMHEVVTGRAALASVVTVRPLLPEATGWFVGRRAELDLLRSGGPGTWVIEGMAGAGKTTLALQAGRELAARFADLQLFVDLRGHDPQRPPADPGAVLDAMLRQLGCAPHLARRLDQAGRAAELRRLLAGRHALVVLDDARDESQVRPLLPDGPTCLTLVTSRRRLTGLDARHVSLGPFTGDEALDLLSRIAGADRVAGEPSAAAGIAEVVGHLPLALSLVASRIGVTPDWTLGEHLIRLRERRAMLSVPRDVEIAIASSYAGLPARRRQLLRLLGIHPGRSVDAYAAAALAGTDAGAATRDLDALVADSLLVRRGPDRFEMHELIRVFAADRASDEDAPQLRAQALVSLVDYYRYVTYAAARLHEPHFLWTMELDRPGTAVPALADRSAATAWLETERANLIACAVQCADSGQPGYTSDLAALLHHYLYMTGQLADAELLDRSASVVATGIDRARALARLGSVCLWLGRLVEARGHYLEALTVIRADGRPDLEARCLANYAMLCTRLGRFAEAADCHRRAMDLHREHGEEPLAAMQLSNIGDLQVLTGDHAGAEGTLNRALAIARATGHRISEADVLGVLGSAALAAGRPEQALDLQQQSLRIFRELGDRPAEGAALNECGLAHTALGSPATALTMHSEALDIAHAIGDLHGEVQALTAAGRALHQLDRHEEALDRHTTALTLAERSGNPLQQARALDGMALALAATGHPDAASRHWRRSLALHVELGTPDAARIAARLSELDEHIG